MKDQKNRSKIERKIKKASKAYIKWFCKAGDAYCYAVDHSGVLEEEKKEIFKEARWDELNNSEKLCIAYDRVGYVLAKAVFNEIFEGKMGFYAQKDDLKAISVFSKKFGDYFWKESLKE